MAKIFNPWESPPTTGTLTGDLASFEINDAESTESTEDSEDSTEMESPETEMPTHEDAMSKAMQLISQQADLINKLIATLGK